jgi:hypothetical protein
MCFAKKIIEQEGLHPKTNAQLSMLNNFGAVPITVW